MYFLRGLWRRRKRPKLRRTLSKSATVYSTLDLVVTSAWESPPSSQKSSPQMSKQVISVSSNTRSAAVFLRSRKGGGECFWTFFSSRTWYAKSCRLRSLFSSTFHQQIWNIAIPYVVLCVTKAGFIFCLVLFCIQAKFFKIRFEEMSLPFSFGRASSPSAPQMPS